MIHTFTIQKELDVFDPLEVIAACMEKSPQEIDNFTSYKGYASEKGHNVLTYIPTKKFPGYEEIKLIHIRGPRRHRRTIIGQFYIYIRMEPLTVINRKQHIKLFECNNDNINKLIEAFKNDITSWLTTNMRSNEMLKDMYSIDRKIKTCIDKLADFTTWDARRMDYTKDIIMNNQDEVDAFVNLAKLSIISDTYNGSKYKSTYGDHFWDDSYKFGNKTKKLTIYNKKKQFEGSKKGKYGKQRYQELLEECNNIARIELQILGPGTRKSSTKFQSRNIMEFLNEERGNSMFLASYGAMIGFEDFYNYYYMGKLLDQAFPLTKAEIKKEKRLVKKAQQEGLEYKPKKHSNKYQLYRSHIRNIMTCKGRDNALKKCLKKCLKNLKDKDSVAVKKEMASAKKKFLRVDKKIREMTGMATVYMPRTWYYSKKMKLPACLKNPIARPECDSTDTP